MLAQLKIENVAVIEKAEVRFTPGLNVLTGETGAGKSILIDSINAILGNRTSRELVRSGAQKAAIWATFEQIPDSVHKQLEKFGYEDADDLLLYREISADGKGSCRVNGMPATAAVVRDISAGLLSIHGQHDSQSLTNPATHLGLLDQYAHNQDLFESYYALYRKLVEVKRQLDSLQAGEASKQQHMEQLSAEIEEIRAASLSVGEEKSLEERRTIITHSQSILEGLSGAHAALSGDDSDESAGAADLLGRPWEACSKAPVWMKVWHLWRSDSVSCIMVPGSWPPTWQTSWMPMTLMPGSWTRSKAVWIPSTG